MPPPPGGAYPPPSPGGWTQPHGSPTPPQQWPGGPGQGGHWGAPDLGDPLISPDYSGWWNRSTTLVKAYWRPLLLLQLIGFAITLPVLVFSGITQGFQARKLQEQFVGADIAEPPQFPDFGEFIAGTLVGTVGSLVAYLVYALILLAGMRLVVVAVAGGPVSVKEGLRGAAPRMFPLIGWQLLGGLLAIAALCACVLPVFYVVAVLAVLPAVVLFERGGVIARCFRLFHGDLGSSLARVVTVIAISIAASMAAGMVGVVFQPSASTSTPVLVVGAVIVALVQAVAQAAAGVVTVPMIATTYADMRARIEPLSTPVLVQELTGAGAQA
jgi:hypothetical protein